MSEKFPKYIRRKNFYPNHDVNEAFKKKFPKYKDVSVKLLQEIMKEYGKLFVQEVMENREGVAFPEMMGTIFIGSSKTKKKVKSYSRYENGKEKRYTNIDTDGRLMKIYYAAQYAKSPFKHYKCWNFQMNKIPRRLVSAYFKENWRKYVDTTNIKIKRLFVEDKAVRIKKYIDKIENYNELDI